MERQHQSKSLMEDQGMQLLYLRSLWVVSKCWRIFCIYSRTTDSNTRTDTTSAERTFNNLLLDLWKLIENLIEGYYLWVKTFSIQLLLSWLYQRPETTQNNNFLYQFVVGFLRVFKWFAFSYETVSCSSLLETL